MSRFKDFNLLNVNNRFAPYNGEKIGFRQGASLSQATDRLRLQYANAPTIAGSSGVQGQLLFGSRIKLVVNRIRNRLM